MKQQYSSEELLTRFEDRREIINLVARYSADFLLKEEKTMFSNYWSKRADVSLALNDGYYVGPEEISKYYQSLYERNFKMSKLLQKRFPEKLGNLSDEEVYGVGLIGYKPLDTGIIEIAEDRQTAKGIWSIRGSYSDLTTGGPLSYWVWGWLAADFVYDNQEWRLWHVMEVYDVHSPCSYSWSQPFEGLPEQPEFAEMANVTIYPPTVKTTVRELYHTDRERTPAPEFPKPYRTFDETFSYGYGG